MKKLLSIILCVVFIFCLVSCQDDDSESSESSSSSSEESSSTSSELPTSTSFDTVEELKIAVKKNPTFYNNKQVCVKGYMVKISGETILANTFQETIRFRLNEVPHIKVIITDEFLRTVAEEGDYMEVCGTVTASDDEIYLDDCTYTMITTYEERK